MNVRQRNWWGWGYLDEALDQAVLDQAVALLQAATGMATLEQRQPPRLEDISLRAPRIQPPPELASICSSSLLDRVSHSYGKAYRDLARALRGRFDNPPDLVAYPRTEAEIGALMDHCAREGIALIPYGGGSSVVGGVEPSGSGRYPGVITVDLKHFDQILEVDQESRCARIQAGIFGPELEAGLKPHNLTLRHFPQSFEFSTLGGWIATRAGGHFATGPTHIDAFVESVRMITPRGVLETRRVPCSGAGPNPVELVLGSEGAFGIITEAWVRLQAIPTFRSSRAVRFQDGAQSLRAVRAISQSGLLPANCRLVSPLEAMSMRLGNGRDTVLLLGFESHDHPVDARMERALALCAQAEGRPDRAEPGGERSAAADTWKTAFLQVPYIRDRLALLGFVVETFETAITWDRFETFHQAVLDAVAGAIAAYGGQGFAMWRFTHVYPDGPAVYYSVVASSSGDRQLEHWDSIKAAACDAIIANGGTITHHHAVGKDHRPWYERERGPLVTAALATVKQSVDPRWILNPDTLIAAAAQPTVA
ncbi:MAG TPA: FAD-binding oxidoreductase [Herpetosiphonaceae bacterium]|nr:FAD-binding oxidoreductase [Herpetosiphonaceae bacterium]